MSFIAGLDRIFRRHDISNSGVTVGAGENTVSKLEYADDAALIDENVEQTSTRVTSIAKGSLEEAAMVISIRKSKVVHVHKKTRVSATIEADVASLKLTHKCSACAREFTKQRGLRIYMARWCDGGRTQRSRLGTLTDKAVQTTNRRLPSPLLERCRSITMCLTMSTRSSIWEADSNVMVMTKPTCVIAWTLHKRHSRHRQTYGWTIAYPAT